MLPKTIIHLLSGGLDSVTMLHDLRRQGHSVHCLLFDYKQRHSQELLWAKHHAAKCGVLFTTVQLPELGGLTEASWVCPFRNAVFMSVAVNVAARANAEAVTIGCNADDAAQFPDCRQPFVESMNAAVKAAGYKIEICAPYINKTKADIAELAKSFGITKSDFWTCYNGGPKPCGTCPACIKAEALCGL